MKLAVAIVNWNSWEYLEPCLRSIERETQTPHGVWVVDNGSTDGSVGKIRREFKTIHLIDNGKNRGFAAANNQVMLEDRSPYFLLLNPDTLILEGALDRMVRYLEENPKIGALGCKLLNGDGTLQPSCHAFYSTLGSLVENEFVLRRIPWKFSRSPWLSFWDHAENRRVDWVTGACLLVRRSTIEEVGLLDERFFMYGEEVDWQWRMKKEGIPVHFLADARIIHYGGGSARKNRAAMNEQELKSRRLLVEKHASPFTAKLYRWKAQLARSYWQFR